MEITITTRPAGSEQRAASSEQPPELLTATPSLLTEPWRRPVWTFTGSTEAAVPQNSSLNVLTLLWKITAEPSRLFLYSRPEKSIRDKKEFTTTTCSDSPVGFSCACFLCFNFTVLLCYWALSIVDADAHILHSINVSILTTENYTVHQTLHHLQIL